MQDPKLPIVSSLFATSNSDNSRIRELSQEEALVPEQPYDNICQS